MDTTLKYQDLLLIYYKNCLRATELTDMKSNKILILNNFWKIL